MTDFASFTLREEVERDDHLGVLHAGEVLDRVRDADGDITVEVAMRKGMTFFWIKTPVLLLSNLYVVC